ncbi:hypothetical protein LY76DRAFT_34002 [Colletotrichum caudatum]|nr:hypothetical protein LY76DRAFT_34002 [Colletotrichum caudatum]
MLSTSSASRVLPQQSRTNQRSAHRRSNPINKCKKQHRYQKGKTKQGRQPARCIASTRGGWRWRLAGLTRKRLVSASGRLDELACMAFWGPFSLSLSRLTGSTTQCALVET